MTVDDVDWNVQYIRTITEEQFISDGLKEGHYKQYSIEDQVKLLRYVYQMALKEQYG